MIKTTVSTAKTVLAEKEKAVESMETVLKLKNEAETCMKYLEVKDDKEDVVELKDDNVKTVINSLSSHVKSRVKRIENELESKMKEQYNILQTAWNEEKEMLDY